MISSVMPNFKASCLLFLGFGVVRIASQPTPALNSTSNSIYPPFGESFTATTTIEGEDPITVRLRYRGQSAMESHDILPRDSIVACAIAFQERLTSYVEHGDAWTSNLGTMQSGEREQDTSGVYLSIKPAIMMGFEVTLAQAFAYMQAVRNAALDTTILPTGFVEEAYIDGMIQLEGEFYGFAPLHMCAGDSASKGQWNVDVDPDRAGGAVPAASSVATVPSVTKIAVAK